MAGREDSTPFPHRSRRVRTSSRSFAGLLLVFAVTLMDFGVGPAWFGQKEDWKTKLRKKIPEKVRVRNFELRTTKAWPFVKFRQIPPHPISSLSATSAVEGGMDDFKGFPFSTKNEGSLSIGIARPVTGKLTVSMTDPTQSSGDDAEQLAAVVKYMQEVPSIGDVEGTLKSSGDWSLGVKREVESLGHLTGTLDSQFDWSVDLEKDYPAFKGFAPLVAYGATQDGMRVQLSVNKALNKHASGRYSVSNPPGKYAPSDFIHQAHLQLSTPPGSKAHLHHAVSADGTFNTKFAKLPVRGSLTYLAKSKLAELEAAVDFDKYRLAARSGPVSLGASYARTTNEEGVQPLDVELSAFGKVSAKALLVKGQKPRVRLAAHL